MGKVWLSRRQKVRGSLFPWEECSCCVRVVLALPSFIWDADGVQDVTLGDILVLLWLGAGFSLVSPLPEEAEAQSTGCCGQQWHKSVSLVLCVQCLRLFVSLLAKLWVHTAGLCLQESCFL